MNKSTMQYQSLTL